MVENSSNYPDQSDMDAYQALGAYLDSLPKIKGNKQCKSWAEYRSIAVENEPDSIFSLIPEELLADTKSVTRAMNSMRKGGILTVQDLAETDLSGYGMRLKLNFGQKSIDFARMLKSVAIAEVRRRESSSFAS